MSAYKTVSCNIVDKQTLLEALKNLGLEYIEHSKPACLYGFGGDKRTQTAEIVVSRSHVNSLFTGASNDIGFKWNEQSKQYNIIVSDYDVGNGIDQRVLQAYAEVAITNALKANKFTVKKTNGNLKLRTRDTVSLVANRII